ncbi:geranylgeranylglycerol-phosphate geranylgeranyltransferase [Niabella drilacis]|uniref:4-hydroxybenzoate polyprenyltransferase n=1 Tax=Niabella drilacis (strain DSM 25811 / CCM 8410 / CCUG 62505 / LMG 26954 / E90) TaxID=1285928 RepID=A0A1G6WS13_NIADE|nr:geranylgeranylglycerol-phosphate geranylgeranyltransferase [Niabella drilacis]SDD68579.1 4-hydroxybenzoate polyprenyltransferase [Niabella drilacis]
MKIAAFFRLVRYPNLIFIALTQAMFQYCIYDPIYGGQVPRNDLFQFILLVLASVFIAAGGNIINDYFDMNIDRINKPQKMIIGKYINRRWALVWHLLLSVLGIVLTAIAVNPFSRWYLVVANILCVLLLWFYSVKFKKEILIGNIVISLLTAWTIMIIFLSKFSFSDAFGNGQVNQLKLFRFAVLYAGFAFMISLVREAIKDMEDIAGDQKYGCNTMPIAWGVNATKVYIAVWLTLLMALLLVVQFYILQLGWWPGVVYCVALIIIPAAYLFRKLIPAHTPEAYHYLSSVTKGIMLTGILSMGIFYFYL